MRHLFTQPPREGEGWGSAHLLPFILSGIPVPGTVLPISKVDLHPDTAYLEISEECCHGDSDSHQVDVRD